MVVMGHAHCIKRTKLDAYWKRYGPSYNSEDSNAKKSEVESNILIQFRSSVSLYLHTQPFLTALLAL